MTIRMSNRPCDAHVDDSIEAGVVPFIKEKPSVGPANVDFMTDLEGLEGKSLNDFEGDRECFF